MSARRTFDGFATSCGAPAVRPARATTLRATLARAFSRERPAASKSVPPRLPLPDTFRF